MGFYIYTPDSDTYDSLVLARSQDYEKLKHFTGGKLASSWQPISARVEKGRKHSDFPSLASHVPVFSKRALDTLRSLLSGEIEALQLEVKNVDLFAINALKVSDCFDPNRAEIKLDSDGEVMRIARYAFDAQCSEGKHMFKASSGTTLRSFSVRGIQESGGRPRTRRSHFSKGWLTNTLN